MKKRTAFANASACRMAERVRFKRIGRTRTRPLQRVPLGHRNKSLGESLRKF